MTNSSSSRPIRLPRLLFIHGLNNHSEALRPLMLEFEKKGFVTEQLILPNHRSKRHEAMDFNAALALFSRSMEETNKGPYFVIAFSQGAQYFQHWLKENLDHRPKGQILLAPALIIKHQKPISRTLRFLPLKFKIKSLSPKKFRLYEFMEKKDYDILFEGAQLFQQSPIFTIPSQVIIDEEDELVDAKRLVEVLEKNNPQGPGVNLIRRKMKGFELGKHHIVFHPDYFSLSEWKDFIHKLESIILDFSQKTL